MIADSSRPSTKPVFLMGLLLVLFTGVFNIGIIALDDYYFVIARIIPAQNTTYTNVTAYAFWSPLLPLVLAGIGKVALALGIDRPANQLRFILFFVGLFTYCVHAYFGPRHFPTAEVRKRQGTLFLLSFFFICPLFFTRPMIENAASAFMMASAYWACEFWRARKFKDLGLAIFALSIASLIRFQSGVCILALLTIVLMTKNRRALGFFVSISLVCGIFTGLVDSLFSGSFHGTLVNYVSYNLNSGFAHGSQPFYVFIALFILLTIPPTFFSRYRGFHWKQEYLPLLPTLLYFLFFVAAHTLTAHKEERFMVPVLPLLLVLLVPMANYLFQQKWRAVYFLGVNAILLPLVVFNSPQSNVVDMAQYLEDHKDISRLVEVGDTLVLFPAAYISRKIERTSGEPANKELLSSMACGVVLAVRTDLKGSVNGLDTRFKKIAEFHPGLLERIVVRLNPQRNFRRGTIEFYQTAHCP